MTGFLRYFKKENKQPRHVRLLVGLENDYFLAYDCQCKLGRISLTESVEHFIEEQKLGPDVLDLCRDKNRFMEQIQDFRGSL